ncbi:hypothetical protein AB0878_10580 [Amycolatopsis sp. NPDC047767]|uniref:hypothetical protein n=1 Tax=Amycolatopsis sp. NPDC047767 TaxID=3156765 RepID=UPI003452D815
MTYDDEALRTGNAVKPPRRLPAIRSGGIAQRTRLRTLDRPLTVHRGQDGHRTAFRRRRDRPVGKGLHAPHRTDLAPPGAQAFEVLARKGFVAGIVAFAAGPVELLPGDLAVADRQPVVAFEHRVVADGVGLAAELVLVHGSDGEIQHPALAPPAPAHGPDLPAVGERRHRAAGAEVPQQQLSVVEKAAVVPPGPDGQQRQQRVEVHRVHRKPTAQEQAAGQVPPVVEADHVRRQPGAPVPFPPPLPAGDGDEAVVLAFLDRHGAAGLGERAGGEHPADRHHRVAPSSIKRTTAGRRATNT